MLPGVVGDMLCGVTDTGESDSAVSCQAKLPGVVGDMLCGVMDTGESELSLLLKYIISAKS